jgi:hypothetical protein
MNLRELGRAAGENLLAAIEGQHSEGLRLLPCTLVLRESSRPRQPTGPVPPVVPGQPTARDFLTGPGGRGLGT